MASILSYKTKSLKHMHLCVHIYVENSRLMITAFPDYPFLSLSFLCSNESLSLPHLFLDLALRLAFLHVRDAWLFLLWVRKPSLPLLDEHNFFLFETSRSFLVCLK